MFDCMMQPMPAHWFADTDRKTLDMYMQIHRDKTPGEDPDLH